MPFKLAFITGATSGIGEALARLLANQNIPLILTGRNKEKLEILKNECGVATEIIPADLARREERTELITIIRQKLPDLIINNAGFGIYGDALTTSLDRQIGMLDVNVHAPFEITLESARALTYANRKGVILNVSSVAGEYPTPGMATYGATKAFLTQFSCALDTEVSKKGVRILVSCPGMVRTDFARRAGGQPVKIQTKMSMTSDYVAERIWRQIQKRKVKEIIDWKYAITIWIAKNCLPDSVVKTAIYRNIQDRIMKSSSK